MKKILILTAIVFLSLATFSQRMLTTEIKVDVDEVYSTSTNKLERLFDYYSEQISIEQTNGNNIRAGHIFTLKTTIIAALDSFYNATTDTVSSIVEVDSLSTRQLIVNNSVEIELLDSLLEKCKDCSDDWLIERRERLKKANVKAIRSTNNWVRKPLILISDGIFEDYSH